MSLFHPVEYRLVDRISEAIKARYDKIEVSAQDVQDYHADQARRAAKPKNWLGLSSHFECVWKLVAERIGLPGEEPAGRDEYAWGNVRAIKTHDAYQKALEDAGILGVVVRDGKFSSTAEMWLDEKTLTPEKEAQRRAYRLTGRIDGETAPPELEFLEIKTHKDGEEDKPWHNEKLTKWYKQTQLGMWLRGSAQGRLIVINRDRPIFKAVREMAIYPNPNYIKVALDRVKGMWAIVDRYKAGDTQALEEAPAEYWKGECNFCIFGVNGSRICPANPMQQKMGKNHPDYAELTNRLGYRPERQ